MTGRSILSGAFLMLVGAAVAWWVLTLPPAGSAKPSKPPLPATVTKTFDESQANVVTLTAEAVQRLNLKTAKVTRKSLPQRRFYGGEVTVPAGQTILVSAPLGGTLSAPKGGAREAGTFVKMGEPIFQLAPLLTPEGKVTLATVKVDTQGQVETAQATYDGAKIALDRAKRLLKSDAGTRTRVEDAQAQYEVAKKTLEAAKARLKTLEKIAADSANDRASPITIEAPEDGLLRNVSALHGQNVHAGASLFEVVNLDRVWVRVPVYVGDLGGIAQEAAAIVAPLAAPMGSGGQEARRAVAPPAANPLTGTVDLFYSMGNERSQEAESRHRYSPGERVGVTLTLLGGEDNLTVPWAAVLFDVYGGTWVYERTGELTFVRRRVLVLFVADEKDSKGNVIAQTAVLKYGPREGTPVVYTEKAEKDRASVGPAELFGAETGFAK